MGSHATCSGAWVSGPEDLSPPEYFGGYNRMLTIDGLFGAGDTLEEVHINFPLVPSLKETVTTAVKYIEDKKAEGIMLLTNSVKTLKLMCTNPWILILLLRTRLQEELFRLVIFHLFKVYKDFKKLWMNM